MMPGLRMLYRYFGGSAMVYGTGAILVLLSQLLLARLLGAESFGIFFYVLSLLLVLVVPAKLGIDYNAQRYIAVYAEHRQWGLLRGLLRWSLWVTLGGSAVVTLGLVLMTWSRDADSELRQTLFIGAALLPLIAFAYLRGGLLRGLHHVARGLAPETLILPLVGLAGIIIYAEFSGTTPGAPAAMTAWCTGGLIAALFGSVWLRRALPDEVATDIPQYRGREWLFSSAGMLVISGAHLLLQNIDVVLLGNLVDTTSAGTYGVASRIAFMVAFPLTIANAVFAPRIAAMWSAGKLDALQDFITHGMRAVGIAALLLASLLFIFHDWLLNLFGPEFAAADTALLILALGQLVNAFCGPVAYLLAYTGHERRVAWVMGTAVLFNVMASLVLIPRLGTTGAAISAALATIGWNLWLYHHAASVTGIRSSFQILGARS